MFMSATGLNCFTSANSSTITNSITDALLGMLVIMMTPCVKVSLCCSESAMVIAIRLMSP